MPSETVPAAAIEQLRFSSVLPESYRAALEELLFFNPGQERVIEGIEASIEHHGLPEVATEAGAICVRVGTFGRVQSLFGLQGRDGQEELVAVILYSRLSVEEVVILHIAVSERFASTGSQAHNLAVLRLFHLVRQATARLKGVRSILMYQPGGMVRFPVSPNLKAHLSGS